MIDTIGLFAFKGDLNYQKLKQFWKTKRNSRTEMKKKGRRIKFWHTFSDGFYVKLKAEKNSSLLNPIITNIYSKFSVPRLLYPNHYSDDFNMRKLDEIKRIIEDRFDQVGAFTRLERLKLCRLDIYHDIDTSKSAGYYIQALRPHIDLTAHNEMGTIWKRETSILLKNKIKAFTLYDKEAEILKHRRINTNKHILRCEYRLLKHRTIRETLGISFLPNLKRSSTKIKQLFNKKLDTHIKLPTSISMEAPDSWKEFIHYAVGYYANEKGLDEVLNSVEHFPGCRSTVLKRQKKVKECAALHPNAKSLLGELRDIYERLHYRI